MTITKRLFFPLIAIGMLAVAFFQPAFVEAGIFDASEEVTYREYWVPHSEFTAGCGDHEAVNGNSWYLEPYGCDKTVEIDIPDDFSQAIKAEIYLDLWRNQDSLKSRFKINEKSTTYKPDVGSDWSRTPYIGTIKLSELKQGTNEIRFWGGGYHVHDIAIRIYYDDDNPLLDSQGQPHTAPTGSLTTLEDDSAVVPANTPATLNVNNNDLTLTATVGEGADYVEFHGYYFGYDEDNDGEFLDWHNRGRNNYYPGGTSEKATGGTIDHVGTVDTPAAGSYSTTWDMGHIPDQDGAKFKIRVVGTDGNVREAAGGVSAEFEFKRNKPLVAFYDPNFEDDILYHDGKYPETVTRTLTLPANLSDYESPQVIHSFWKRPRISVNGASSMTPGFQNGDDWQLAINSFNMNLLNGGTNEFIYTHQGGFGEFIEKPGPMVILRKKTAGPVDTTPPTTSNHNPAPNATNIDPSSNVSVTISDNDSGVDQNTIVMKVNGKTVSPNITGNASSYNLTYNPNSDFVFGSVVTVEIRACDLNAQCMVHENYVFEIEGAVAGTEIESDDFNVCELDDSRWFFVDPLGDSSLSVTGEQVVIDVAEGTRHDLWSSPHNTAPRLMQAVDNGNFTVEAKFESSPTENIQFQGIIVQIDGTNALRFEIFGNGSEYRARAYDLNNDSASSKGDLQIASGAPAYLRVERSGSTWKAFYSPTGEDNSWTKYAHFDRSATVRHVGVFAGNAGNNPPAFSSVVDYVFNHTSRIEDEDGTALELPVTVVGNGTVTKDPECGNPVTLTAEPDLGWYFQGWTSTSGNISGTETPLTTGFDHGEAVTATFAPEEYDLTVTVDHQSAEDDATVTVSPQQTIYYYGDEVTLTANTPDGWEFLGWTGDVDDVADPSAEIITFTMSESRDITATFISKHSFDVTVVSRGEGTGGAVTQDPVGTEFYYGDTVELTATPEPGWLFLGWQGDGVDETDATVELVVGGDLALEAIFAEIVSVSVSAEGPGSVAVSDPANGDYVVGEVITLTGTPDGPNYYFSKWSGSVESSENPLELELTGDTTVVGTFTDNRPPEWDEVAEQTIPVYQPWTLSVSATDPDGDALAIMLDEDNSPEGVVVEDNGDGSAEISWTPAATQSGSQIITVIVDDGTTQSILTIEVTVSGSVLFLPVVMSPTP